MVLIRAKGLCYLIKAVVTFLVIISIIIIIIVTTTLTIGPSVSPYFRYLSHHINHTKSYIVISSSTLL